jgi:hypothetical protein
VPAELTETADGVAPDFFVSRRVLVAFDRPEPELFLLFGRDGLVEAEGDDFAAQFGGGVDGAVAVGQVGFPVAFFDDAAADRGDDRDADAYVGCSLFEFGEALCAEVAGADPAVREVRVCEAGLHDLGEDLGPSGGVGVVDVGSLGVGARELKQGRSNGPVLGCVGHGVHSFVRILFPIGSTIHKELSRSHSGWW